jgi:hypothetical protein
MGRHIAAILIGLAIGAGVGVFLKRRRARRRADELTHHPERLDEMLDPTDDA